MNTLRIRDVEAADASEVARIYRPAVTETVISFEEHPPDADEMAGRIAATAARYPWLVCERDGIVAGYAYAHGFRERYAYRYSAEVSVYVDFALHRSGIGGMLYAALLERLRAAGYHRAFAGIAMPNEGSVALHQRMGFEPVGTFREAGFKLDRWVDVSWWQRAIRA